jgi:hypothetical protein
MKAKDIIDKDDERNAWAKDCVNEVWQSNDKFKLLKPNGNHINLSKQGNAWVEGEINKLKEVFDKEFIASKEKNPDNWHWAHYSLERALHAQLINPRHKDEFKNYCRDKRNILINLTAAQVAEKIGATGYVSMGWQENRILLRYWYHPVTAYAILGPNEAVYIIETKRKKIKAGRLIECYGHHKLHNTDLLEALQMIRKARKWKPKISLGRKTEERLSGYATAIKI